MKFENKKELIETIENVVETEEDMRYAYFCTPNKKAACRRFFEEKHSTKKVEWEEGGNVYTAQFITKCSYQHIYAKGHYTRNSKKTTLTAIKNSLNRLKAS